LSGIVVVVIIIIIIIIIIMYLQTAASLSHSSAVIFTIHLSAVTFLWPDSSMPSLQQSS
jgi:hypothetical protein